MADVINRPVGLWSCVALVMVGCAQPCAAPAVTHNVEGAVQTLDRLDRRAAVPLVATMANHQKQNMREHLEAIQEIVAGLAALDFATIERAANHLGTSEGTNHMCEHMGAAAPGFTDQAMAFHHQANGIASAARLKDSSRVLSEVADTLKACTACHATWKQQLVDEATWKGLAATASDRGTTKR